MFVRVRPTILGRHARGIGFYLVISMCLISCLFVPGTPKSTIDVGDGGFLSGEPCGPPCFWGIVPGQTAEAEVEEILRERGVYATCETRASEFEEGGRGIDCGSWVFISFEQEDDLVQGVYFILSSSITVQEVIAKYGEPDGVLVFPEGVPEHPRLSLYMVYSSILSRLELPTQEWPGYVVEPSTPVLSVVYAPEFSDVREHPFSREWTGYGEY